MLKSTIKKLQDGVTMTRNKVADLAESVGAPGAITSALRVEAAAGDDPWSNPRAVQSPDGLATRPSAAPAAPAAAATAPTIPAPSAEDAALRARVQKVIEEMVNPVISGHGGYITLLAIKDKTAYVEMGGGCQGCAASRMTLKSGVERMICEEIPEIEHVVDETDHAQGDNPYFAR